MNLTKNTLRQITLSNSLFSPTTLASALDTMQFVQIDPIRAPAPAQDLILRQRVKNYRVGDIEKAYSRLDLEEDFLYAHGYMKRELWSLLHPRNSVTLSEFDTAVLEAVKNMDEIDPDELDSYFEKKRELNWWGGYSRSTKMALERLHYYGYIRVSRRKNGIRMYKYFHGEDSILSLDERLENILLTIITIMAPVTAKTLTQSLHRIHRHFGNTRHVLDRLLKSGKIYRQSVDGIPYILLSELDRDQYVSDSVKILAPFDPVVRDRIRFEHLWDWKYQFEAYVPANKRIRGYYAMPLLWRSEMIGWVNCKKNDRALDFEIGYIQSKPTDRQFSTELEAEMERLRQFALL